VESAIILTSAKYTAERHSVHHHRAVRWIVADNVPELVDQNLVLQAGREDIFKVN